VNQLSCRLGGFGGSFVEFFLTCFNGTLLSRNVLDSCMKSGQYFCMDKISLEMSFHWLSEDIVKFKIKVGVYEKYTKM